MAQTRFGSDAPRQVEAVRSLAEALIHFEKNLNVRKTQDVILSGARVGAVYVIDGENRKYLVLYKRERYLYFSRHFPQVPDKDQAIIANIKLVHWAAMQEMGIATVFPDGSCYAVKASEFWTFYERWITEHPKLPGEIALPVRRWTRIIE